MARKYFMIFALVLAIGLSTGVSAQTRSLSSSEVVSLLVDASKRRANDANPIGPAHEMAYILMTQREELAPSEFDSVLSQAPAYIRDQGTYIHLRNKLALYTDGDPSFQTIVSRLYSALSSEIRTLSPQNEEFESGVLAVARGSRFDFRISLRKIESRGYGMLGPFVSAMLSNVRFFNPLSRPKYLGNKTEAERQELTELSERSACISGIVYGLSHMSGSLEFRRELYLIYQRVPRTKAEIVVDGYIEGDWDDFLLSPINVRSRIELYSETGVKKLVRTTPSERLSLFYDPYGNIAGGDYPKYSCALNSERLVEYVRAQRTRWFQSPGRLKGPDQP